MLTDWLGYLGGCAGWKLILNLFKSNLENRLFWQEIYLKKNRIWFLKKVPKLLNKYDTLLGEGEEGGGKMGLFNTNSSDQLFLGQK